MHQVKPGSAEALSFLSGGGEMGEMIRSYPWKNTSIGRPETWPQSLRTCVRIMLSSRQPIWIGWGKELIKFYNDPYLAIIGGKHPWALGKPASEVWNDIWKDIEAMLEQVMEKGEGTYVESQLLIMERNGYPEETYYTFSYTPIPGDDGSIAGMFCANTDDTDRIISQRQLRTLTNLGKRLTDSQSNTEIISKTITTLQGNPYDFPFALFRTISNNKAILAASTPLGDSAKLVPAEIDLSIDSPISVVIREALATKKLQVMHNVNSKIGELPKGAWNIAPDKVIVLPITQTAARDPYGVLVVGLNPFRLLDEKYSSFFSLVADQVATSFADVHVLEEERKRASALAEIDRAKTIFFSNISHEFRTPLTLMLGPIEDMLQDVQLDENERTKMEVAFRNGLRLQKLVNTLLDYSRLEAGRVEGNFVKTDICVFTTDLASTFRSAIEKAGMQLIIHCSEISGDVYVDVDMWEKIILNLISNAFKYSKEGTITLQVKQEGEEVLVSVSDTGIGIPESHLDKIFDRFHRVDNKGGRSQEGTGIGLAMVKELVKLHHGNITVESREGQGSTFTVYIPVGHAHFDEKNIIKNNNLLQKSVSKNVYVGEALRWIPDNKSDDSTTSANNIGSVTMGVGEKAYHVLLADDNADMREYVSKLLRNNYKVTPVQNGRIALEKAKELQPDLIISDVMMPEMDGFELVGRLKEERQTRNIPVILLSARAGEEARIEGLQSGADDYMVKPFSAKELLTRVSSSIKIAKNRIAAEENIRNVFMQAPVAACILRGPNHVIELANSFALELWGKRGEDVMHKPAMEAFPELVVQGFTAILDKVYQTGEKFVANEMLIELVRNGMRQKLFINFVYEPLLDDKGLITGIVGVGVDVTEQSLARQRAEENETYFRKLTNNIPVMIWRTDAAGQCFYLSQRWYDYTGQSPEEAMGFGWLDRLHPDDVKTSGEVFMQALQDIKPFNLHYRLKGKDGIYKYMLDAGHPVFSEEGKFEGFLGVVLDVHEQKLAELALEESEVRQKLAVEASGMGMWEVDVATANVISSEKTKEIFGFTGDSVSLEDVFNTMVPEDRERVKKIVFDAMNTESGIYKAEYTVQNRLDGSRRAVVANGKFFFDDEGKPIKFVGTCLDVTQQKMNEEILENKVEERTKELSEANLQLETSNKELEQFAFVTSHDLQEPLRKIQTFSNLLYERSKDQLTDTAVNYLGKINTASKRMSALINDLLNFSRLSRKEEGYVQVDLNEVVSNIKNDFELLIAQKAATVTTSNLPMIEAIPLQMNQLFYNLMSNALKFSKEEVKPEITITCKELSRDEKISQALDSQKTFYLIQFKDNGIGFDQEYSEKIFEIFQRLNARTQYEGTGIGLALVNRIVGNHSGKVSAISKEGAGATFNIILPKTKSV